MQAEISHANSVGIRVAECNAQIGNALDDIAFLRSEFPLITFDDEFTHYNYKLSGYHRLVRTGSGSDKTRSWSVGAPCSDMTALFFLGVNLWRCIKRLMLDDEILIVVLAVAIDIDHYLDLVFFARLVGSLKIVRHRVLVA